MNSKLLSKSKYLNGLQCLKLLWVTVNDPGRLPPVDAATQHTFDQGHEVGELAHKLFPDGINLSNENFAQNLKDTREAFFSERKTLLEAGIASGRLYCRVDIFSPAGEDEWDIVEVKSSTEVKDEHLDDVAFQRHVCTQAGLSIRRCHVMHINKDYTKHGEIDPQQLFVSEDITDRLDEFSLGIEQKVEAMMECIDLGECPDGAIGRRCELPYPCTLTQECWEFLPEHHVMTLNYGKKLGEELLGQGILSIADIPGEVSLSAKQQIQRECILCGEPHVSHAELKGFLKTLRYPLYFLDFETFQTAIPLYDGTRPYQQIPFQFSVHVMMAADAEVEHHSYLAEGRIDPRPGLLSELKRVIGTQGSILAYNASFEKGRLEESAKVFPEHKLWIENALGRMVDLMAPFKGFLYYHPDQCGHVSLKNVLPALTGISYDGFEICDGGTASTAYLEATFGKADEERIQKIRADLLTYCGQDTEGMVDIVKQLGELL